MNAFKIKYSVDGQVKITEQSNDDIKLIVVQDNCRTTVTLCAQREIELLELKTSYPFKPDKNDLYFFNGYQSWTDTKEFTVNERGRDVKKLPKFLVNAFAFDRYGDASFHAYGKHRMHGYDVFYCKGKNDKFILNLNYALCYLLIELDKKQKHLNLHYDYNCYHVKDGEQLTVADYYASDSVTDGMAYFDNVFPKKNMPKIFGYTSWYNYYQNINEQVLLRDLEALDGQFNLFQIDDGYETKVGDWLSVDKNKFPNGLKPIADAAHSKGLKAGIWLAPFVAEEKSELFATRKDLFKRTPDGGFVKCGANWSGFYALDLENGEARDYVKKCLCHYADMGFDFFKLDFLYAVNLEPTKGKSRSMVAQEAYTFLRECLKDKIILGCGATVFNCINNFDYLRVGPDISLKFDDVWYMRHMHRERISTKVTLQNTVYRSFFNDRLFGNDPDVFLLRDDNVWLSDAQKRALLTLNALFGNVLMTSDNLASYDDKKRKLLNDALELFYGANVISYTRKGRTIEIVYDLNGNSRTLKYDTEKGVLL
ncbi:MAG: alpha-galactosidase [Clostridia bacterium]|nr:alpha-galactosidase [Clostridia bacterium]